MQAGYIVSVRWRCPRQRRVAVLLNPANASSTEPQIRIVHEAAATIGLQIQILNATTIGEIDAAFATLERERPDALFVAGAARAAAQDRYRRRRQ
jgi:ABC-type uncharacterized transport system substrate-binding protein